MPDRHEGDAPYFRMFEQWPCNTFKPSSHILAKSTHMYVRGKGAVEGYRGAVISRKAGEPWVVSLNDGSEWRYDSTRELMADWSIVRDWDEVCSIRKERGYK